MPSQVNNLSPRILVIGVGGAGGNIINSMKDSGVEGVEFLNVNTDSQQLKNSKVETAVGDIPIDSAYESKIVDIHIRPQAIKLSEEKTPVNGVKGTVMASKLMGSYSFIHLSVLDENKEVIHVHSHMPANFNPKQSTAVGIEIDEEKVFVFPKK